MTNKEIRRVSAWEVLDSRGRPTVACKVELANGGHGTARVPSGMSTGSHEAVELRDGGTRYGGSGVTRAVAGVVEHLAPHVVGLQADQTEIVDAALDDAWQSDSSVVGSNSTLAVSLATLLAAADAERQPLARFLFGAGTLPLPMPMINIISGGAHAAGAIDLQDFLVIPEGAQTFAQAIEWAARVRDTATAIAFDRGFPDAGLVADEGGLGLRLGSNEAALDLLCAAIEKAGLGLGSDASIAIDAAATEFATPDGYHLAAEARTLHAEELIELYRDWTQRYPIRSIEDALAEDDWHGWQLATRELGDRIDLIGDDLFVTQHHRLRRGITTGCANSILVKVNQNGLVSRSGKVLREAAATGYRTVVSARSGETEDSWVADLAIGWDAGQLKVGSTQRSERTAKWNRVLELEATEDTQLQHPWVTKDKQ